MSDFPSIGEVFLERYRLESVIGRGGYAMVYKARQIDLERDVAVKILRLEQRGKDKAEEARKRFEREAKLASQLSDPQTITVFDHGTDDRGRHYMVSELVPGRNLHEVIQTSAPIEPFRALRILSRILYSLQEAHERGVLHRDIKPANIMIYDLRSRPDQVKVLDFGIAKAFSEDWDGGESMQAALTAKGRVMGSPGYMAPEQIRGESLDARTDIYSAGLVTYEMLTGERAIAATNDLRAAFEQIEGAPIRLPAKLEISDDVRQLVEKMVEKHPQHRFQDVASLLEALDGLTRTPDPEPAQKSGTRRWKLIAAFVGAVALLAGTALLLW